MEKKIIKKAAAISYTPGEDKAPKVIAKGKGVVAEKILEKAQEENVPVFKDKHLADTLTEIEIGAEIPVEMYEVVAEVLSFISRVDEEAGKKFGL